MIVVTIVKVNTKFTDMVNSLCIPHLVLVHSLSLIRKKKSSACDYLSFCSFSLWLHENLKVLGFPGFHDITKVYGIIYTVFAHIYHYQQGYPD